MQLGAKRAERKRRNRTPREAVAKETGIDPKSQRKLERHEELAERFPSSAGLVNWRSCPGPRHALR